jgi:hypothetical protein
MAVAVKKSSIHPIQCFQIRFEVSAQSKPCMTLADLADGMGSHETIGTPDRLSERIYCGAGIISLDQSMYLSPTSPNICGPQLHTVCVPGSAS